MPVVFKTDVPAHQTKNYHQGNLHPEIGSSYTLPLPPPPLHTEASDQFLKFAPSCNHNWVTTNFQPHSNLEVPSYPHNLQSGLQDFSSGNHEALKYFFELDRFLGVDSRQNAGN
jgi:hypothetical protein